MFRETRTGLKIRLSIQYILSFLLIIRFVLGLPGAANIEGGHARKRHDLKYAEADDLEDISLFPELGLRPNLAKRQNPTCSCVENADIFYPITQTSSYMATPFGRCDVSASTSNLCPTNYICACQGTSSSICLPTTVQTTTECGTIYSGPTDRSPTTKWLFSSIPTYLAVPSGQCGGVFQSTETAYWAPSMTLCPVNQACVCQSSGAYSVCIDTTASGYRGTDCPNPCATVKQEFKVSLPPPSATAKLGGQCGGRCWTGPTNCPIGATCFTETSPVPGAYAECATINPNVRLRVRNEQYEGINVPARARAMATPIYF
ncbi:hypothetical protein TWF730_007360 [Orbilia blumenaviensis]|uniref:CBM1 domain-containing protein n=1 Tax=Orbilia blumenaviensis TaxID=1796055 RepID=A0AAV9V7H8_9PEZI